MSGSFIVLQQQQEDVVWMYKLVLDDYKFVIVNHKRENRVKIYESTGKHFYLVFCLLRMFASFVVIRQQQEDVVWMYKSVLFYVFTTLEFILS